MRRDLRRAVAFCLLLLVFCAGCGLPVPRGTASVRKVSGPAPDDDSDAVRRIPAGPVPGESASSILKGFLAAGPAPDVAREYLTATTPWHPLESTTVFTGDPTVTTGPPTGDTVAATATITAILAIASDGSTSVPSTGPLHFTLTKASGEWRIDNPPDGTELSQVDLASDFRRGTLGWVSPDRHSLVRQSVLLPGDPSQLGLDLVKELIAGPSLDLADAGVVSLIPSRFTAVSAAQNGTQLVVSLQSNGAVASASELTAIRAQFAATLLSAEITSVQVDVDSQPLLGANGSGAPITAADETDFDRNIAGSDGVTATPYLADAAGVHALTLPASVTGSAPSPAVTPATPTPGTSPTASRLATTSAVPVAFAVSVDGQRFAELRPAKGGLQPVQIIAATGKVQPFGSAGDYTSLAWGSDDALWLTTSTGDVSVAPSNHAPVKASHGTVPVPLRDIVIAPDGVHAVGISTAGRLVTALASASASPPQLSSLSVAAPSLTKVTAVAVVGSDPAGGLELLVAGTRSANQLLPDTGVTPVTGLWRVSTGAPDPAASTPELLSETISSAAPACLGTKVVGLAGRPGVAPFAECGDGSLEAYHAGTTASPPGWVRVGSGLAGYPLG